MNNQLGAHETLELHEVLQGMLNGINLFKLYKPFIRDNNLERLMIHQLGFLTNEYNILVSNLGSITEGVRSYGFNTRFIPKYGLHLHNTQQPAADYKLLDDKDISNGMLGLHKTNAKLKINAALECADPELKEILVDSSNNSVYQAFDVWSFMNKKGFYQVPTLPTEVSHQLIHQYEPLTSSLGSRY